MRAAAAGLLLCLMLPVGCGPVGNGRTELVLLTPGGQVRRAAEPAVRRFEAAHPEVRVRMVTTPGRDYYVKALGMMAGNADLDVLWLGMGFGMFAHRGALLDLTEIAATDPDFDAAAFHAEVLEWYSADGRLFGLPHSIDAQAFAVNLDLFESLGLDPPDADWTVAEMLGTGRALVEARADGRGPGWGLGMEELRLATVGLALLNDDASALGLGDAEGSGWLENNIALARSRVLLRTSGPGELDRLGEFLNQRVAIAEVFSWDMPELERRAAFRWKLLPPPLRDDGARGAWASSSGFAVSARGRHPQLAWELLKYLVSEEVQRELLASSIPALKSLAADYATQRDEPDFGVFISILPALRPDPRIAAQDEVLGEWRYWMERAHQGQITPAQAVREARKRINRILHDTR